MSQIYWGLDIGGTKCALVTGTKDCRVLSRHQIDTAAYPGWRQVLEALLSYAPHEPPAAIGISCGGPLNSRRGLILSPPNLPGWDQVPITAFVSEKTGAPAYLQNDANACALAEWRFGAGQGCDNMVFLTFGTGLGAGLILGGRLYTGANDMAGEVGHVRAAQAGPMGYGKRGSFEGFCSGGGIFQLSGGRTAREVVELADAGDEQMQSVLETSARRLGQCLAMLIDLINPERIVIGSIYARAERWFRHAALEVVRAEALGLSQRACRILPAQLGDAIGDMAALSVAIHGA